MAGHYSDDWWGLWLNFQWNLSCCHQSLFQSRVDSAAYSNWDFDLDFLTWSALDLYLCLLCFLVAILLSQIYIVYNFSWGRCDQGPFPQRNRSLYYIDLTSLHLKNWHALLSQNGCEQHEPPEFFVIASELLHSKRHQAWVYFYDQSCDLPNLSTVALSLHSQRSVNYLALSNSMTPKSVSCLDQIGSLVEGAKRFISALFSGTKNDFHQNSCFVQWHSVHFKYFYLHQGQHPQRRNVEKHGSQSLKWPYPASFYSFLNFTDLLVAIVNHSQGNHWGPTSNVDPLMV